VELTSGVALSCVFEDVVTIEVVLQEVGKTLHAPSAVVAKCIGSLHRNGIFILDPLKKYTDQDWQKLELPLAVLKELQDKVKSLPAGNSCFWRPFFFFPIAISGSFFWSDTPNQLPQLKRNLSCKEKI
jgi:hypothetical protein